MTDANRRELQRLLEWWQDHGLVRRDAPHTVRSLIDLGLARNALIDAIAEFTPAWHDLQQRCVTLTRRQPENEHEQSPRRQAIIASWLSTWNLEQAQWLAGFVECAIVLIESGDSKASPDRVRAEMETSAPPDANSIINRLNGISLLRRWQDSEPPPDPFFESQTEFIERMRGAYAARVAAFKITAPTKRRISQHAEWFARFQVGSESVGQLLARYPDNDRSTIIKALKSFGELIDLAPRRLKVGVN